jgi:hypothetical protein
MAWTPRYFAVQEEGIIDNALFIITRDFKEALDTFYTIEAALSPDDPQYLEDFQEHSLGQIQKLVFPTLAIGPNRNAASESDARDRLKQAVRFDIYVGVTADSAANVTTKIMRYMGTLDAVLRSAKKADWKRNMSAIIFGIVLESEHVYGSIRERESIYYRDALMQVTLTFSEQ